MAHLSSIFFCMLLIEWRAGSGEYAVNIYLVCLDVSDGGYFRSFCYVFYVGCIRDTYGRTLMLPRLSFSIPSCRIAGAVSLSCVSFIVGLLY